MLAEWCSPVLLKQEDKALNSDGVIRRNRGINWLEAEGRGALFRVIWFDLG